MANGRARDGAATEVPITVVEPDRAARGGIVVLHESREFTDTLLSLMSALAAEGWTVVAPNLFHRSDESEAAAITQVFGDDLFDDFDACFDWLTGRGVFPDTVGVLGFDTAGTAAFLVATNRPIGAAVSVSARGILEPIAEQGAALVAVAPQLQAPWLGLFGTGDPATPADVVDRLRDATARASVASLVVRYPDLHHRVDSAVPKDVAADPEDGVGGTDDTDDTDADLVDSQSRIFDWFDSNLR